MLKSKYAAFTLDQHARLRAWSAERPYGLRVNVVADHEEIEEVAELFLHDPETPLYFLIALETGAVEVGTNEGQAELAPDLDAALALVERVERS